jgi:ribosomal-protein-alanine N-acetyltransferase
VNRRLEPVAREAATLLATPLSQLHHACFPDDPWPPQALAEIISLRGFFGQIVWEDDEPAGLALAQDLAAECEILSVGVVPGRRRGGIGAMLLSALVEEAARRRARTMFLEVAEDNSAARALYAASGFVQIGRRTNYYRRASGLVDALVLRLLLST